MRNCDKNIVGNKKFWSEILFGLYGAVCDHRGLYRNIRDYKGLWAIMMDYISKIVYGARQFLLVGRKGCTAFRGCAGSLLDQALYDGN